METLPPKRKKALTLAKTPGALRQCLILYLEGVQFDLLYATPREVAYKAVATALSDLAAQGGRPTHVLVQASLRQETNEHLVMELETGVAEAAKRFKVTGEFVLGSVSPNAHLLQVLATGVAKTPAKNVSAKKSSKREMGPQPGDVIAVTGALGAASGALQCLRQLGRSSLIGHEKLAEAYLKPAARIAEACFLNEKNLAVTFDIQDGLAAELNAALADYDLGAMLLESSLPLSPLAKEAAQILAVPSDRWSLYGAEDFELLFFCAPGNWAAIETGLKKIGVRATPVGQLRPAEEGVKIETLSGEITNLPSRMWHPLVRRRRA